MSSKITKREKICYILANVGNVPVQAILGSYLLIFYTNIIGLSPASCATLFLIARILDGLNDPIVGYFIDHRKVSKMGHFRPTLMLGSVLCGLNFLLLWLGPYIANTGKLAIAYISYLLIGIIFPIMDISLNSMLPVMTDDPTERNSLSSIKGITLLLGVFGINIIAPIIIGDTSKANGYIQMIIVATFLVVVCSLVGALGLKERVQVKSGQEKYKFKNLIDIIKQQPVWSTFLCALLYTTGTYVVSSSNLFFYTYVLNNLMLLSLASMLQMVAMIPATILAPLFIKKMGKKNAYIVGLFCFGIFPIIRLVNVTNIPILMLATAVAGFGSGLAMPLQYGIQADNTDYVELKLGYRAEGAVASLSSFITKCAMGIGGAIPGYLLALVHFDSSNTLQTVSVKNMITLCTIGSPVIFCILAILVFKLSYPITKEKLEVQNRELKKLH
ncbi:sugar (glycoside-pentoside-hexuronide) transporter [Lachnospiraceae bacterium PF1-21]|nr:MFS transporter [Lachnospiraceae bacterium OttesenSCG-928-J05]